MSQDARASNSDQLSDDATLAARRRRDHLSEGEDDDATQAGEKERPGKDGEQDESNENEGGDEEGQKSTPTPVGFWDHRLKHVRHEAMLKWVVTTAFLMGFIITCLSLYWGALSHAEKNIGTIGIFVVDFDGQVAPYNTTLPIAPVVGPAITKYANELVASSTPNLGYEVRTPDKFNYDPMQVRQAVYDWHAWAAIIVNPNATALLYDAVHNGNASYDPTGACQLIYISSRDDTNWYDFMYPLLSPFMTEATSMVGKQWVDMVMKNVTGDTTLLSNAAKAPQALSPAIGFSQYDLRPFYPYTAIPAVSIGLIYLIIVSFFSFSFYLPIHFKYLKPEGHPPLKFYQLTLWRWISTLSAYFMLSLAYSLISLAFQINFSGGNPVTADTEVTISIDGFKNPDAYGHGTFPVYWMLNFFGMIALGLACENMAMIVGQPWVGLWLIFWVISNVSTAFYDINIEPAFYLWGYAWPLHHVVQGSRQILFGLHNTLALNFGVLVAWGALNTILFPICCYFMRWKSKHHVHEYYK